MDKELEQLLEQLKEVANDTQSQSQFQEATPTQEYTPQQDNSNVEEQFKSWKEIGIIRFTSKYQNLPKFYQILNMVIPRADKKVLADIQAGRVRDDYLDYLEEAYKEAIKEIASFSKDILSSQLQNRQSNTNTTQMPDYDMNKYYNDYKKYLEEMTVKDVAIIEFKDGIEENGRVRSVGIPKASLEERIKISEN